jgi:hypothetical protein
LVVVAVVTWISLADDGVPAVKVTVAVFVTGTDPFTVALITALPTVADRTVPVVCPDAFVAAAGCTKVSDAPRDEERTTVAPGTGLL